MAEYDELAMRLVPANKVVKNYSARDIFIDFTSGADFSVSVDGGDSYTVWDLSSVATYPHVITFVPRGLYKFTIATRSDGAVATVSQ